MPRPIAVLFYLSCFIVLVVARELHVLNSSVLNCSTGNADGMVSPDQSSDPACSKTKLLDLQHDVVTIIYENDGSGGNGSSRLISYKSSDLPQIPGLVEWGEGKQRRLVGSRGCMQRHGDGPGKDERAVIGADDRNHPLMTDPYDKVTLVHDFFLILFF